MVSRQDLARRLDTLPELSHEASIRMSFDDKPEDRSKVEREIVQDWVKIGDYFRIDDPKMVPKYDANGELLRRTDGAPQVDLLLVKCADCGERYGEGMATFVYLHPDKSKRESYSFPYRVFHVMHSARRHDDDVSEYVTIAKKILAGKPLE